MSIEIIPAILPRNFAEIIDKVSLVKGLVKTVQIDICDGNFVPNITWPFNTSSDGQDDKIFERILKEEDGLPSWQEVNYEFDLMVNFKDAGEIEKWVQMGASRIILHIESKGDMTAVIEKISDEVEIGLALNIGTPIDSIEPFKNKIQFVQLMGINRVGFQGQEFDHKVIGKIKGVRAEYLDLPISIDGGVSLQNAGLLIDAGANRLVIGSAIFEAEDVEKMLEQFRKL